MQSVRSASLVAVPLRDVNSSAMAGNAQG